MNQRYLTVKRFEKEYLTTIEEVQKSLDILVDRFSEKKKNSIGLDKTRLEILLKNLFKFKDLISETMFLKLEPWWFYSYLITPRKFTLSLCYYRSDFKIDDRISPQYLHLYDLIVLDIPSLSVKDYANKYNVEEVTVRQWIRRGKLLDAYKTGEAWRIPELALVDNQPWKDHHFVWTENNPYLPKEYMYLTKSKSILILQDDKPNSYCIYCGSKRYFVNKKEKEKIELMLISTPMIEYISDSFIRIQIKDDLIVGTGEGGAL